MAIAVLFSFIPAQATEYQAGPVSNDFSVLYYQNNRVLLSSVKEFNVKKIHGFNLTPLNITKRGKAGESVVFNHQIENLGNSSEKIGFRVSSVPPGLEVRVRVDNALVEELVLPEGSASDLSLTCKLPVSLAPGKTCSVQLIAASAERDGDEYLGFDGKLHGGKDEIKITDRIDL